MFFGFYLKKFSCLINYGLIFTNFNHHLGDENISSWSPIFGHQPSCVTKKFQLLNWSIKNLAIKLFVHCLNFFQSLVEKFQLFNEPWFNFHHWSNTWIFFSFAPNIMKKRCFTTELATQFLSCNDHLQLTIFLHPWVPSNKLHELQKIQFIIYTISLYAIHCNTIGTLLQQFLFNYYVTPLWLQS
jgi:hypothetical protein